MSFQKGNTFVFGETPAASKWDQLWRNDDALADGSGLDDNSITTAKLADGSVTSDKLNMSRCVLYETGGQNIPSGTFTPIAFTTEIDDPLNMHNTSSNTSRITVPEAGVYLVTGGLRLGDNTTDTVRIAELRRNGSTNTIADYRSGVDSGGRWAANLSTICMLNANDYIELYVLQTSGSTLAATFRHLAVVRIS